MRLVLFLWIVSFAHQALANPCRIEMPGNARAICLKHEVDQRVAQMNAAIEQVLSGLQAISGPDHRVLRQRYRDSQSEWASAVEAACDSQHPTIDWRREECRLRATSARINEVRASLIRASRDFGGPLFTSYELEVEIVIPLTDHVGAAPVLPLLRFKLPLLPE